MNHDPLTDEVRSAYDTVAQEYAACFPGTEPEEQVDLAMITHFVEQLTSSNKEVLDAGCGTGRISRFLSDRGCVVHGVDLSPGMLAMARRDHPDIATQVASITDLPFSDARFDGILYWYSIIHVADSDLAAVFHQARRVLRPGGVVLIAFQAGQGARDVAGAYRTLGYNVTLTRFHRTADQVSGLLAAADFREEARLVRRSLTEKDDQAFLIFKANSPDD